MKKIILLEYFTSQSIFHFKTENEILKEALSITNSIIKNFAKNKYIQEIVVIRNQELSRVKIKKVKYLFTSKKKTYVDILNNLNNKIEVLIIAPETAKINLEFCSTLRKKSTILNSSSDCFKTFSSKIKTFKALKKLRIPAVKNYNCKKFHNSEIIIKPVYGAGSENIMITYADNFKGNKRDHIFQKYHKGTKGSFLMLCNEGESRVLCCNKQIIEIKNKRIKQVGCVMGGLESYRKEIEKLAQEITSGFEGLFGIIGVDIVRESEKWLVIEINNRFTSSYCGLENAYCSKTLDIITEFYAKRVINKSKINFIEKINYFF